MRSVPASEYFVLPTSSLALHDSANVAWQDDLCRTSTSSHVSLPFPSHGPNRKTVRRHLGLMYHEYRQSMQDSLKNVEHIALTTDVWTKGGTSFICLTGHAFNQKYELVSIVLGFRRLVGQHLGDTLRTYIKYELEQLGIDTKICGTTSDNGSDVKKATRTVEFGIRFWCIAHCLNLVVRNGLALWPKAPRRK